jgi:thiosulfate dehydrogenase
VLKGVVIGVLVVIVIGLAGAFVAVETGALPANADAKPGAIERWAAMTSLHATIRRQAPSGPDALPATDDNLIAGIEVYASNCLVCHGGPDGRPSNVARGLYQTPPQLARDGVEDDPAGATYWKVDHGIRWTGMPSFRSTLSQDQIWQVALFLEHMDSLPPAAQEAWMRLPSAAGASPFGKP